MLSTNFKHNKDMLEEVSTKSDVNEVKAQNDTASGLRKNCFFGVYMTNQELSAFQDSNRKHYNSLTR